MNICCTDKFLKELKLTPQKGEIIDSFYSWHMTVITINHRKTFIMTNDSNRMVVLFYNVRLKDYPYLPDLILKGIKEVFLEQMIRPALVDIYIKEYPGIVFTAQRDALLEARLNTAASETELLESFIKKSSVGQPYINRVVNESVREVSKNLFSTPYELLHVDFSAYYGEKVIETKALQLRVELDIKKQDVWCELIIPDNFYFVSLHNIIQTVFNWGDESLHDFHVYSKEQEILNIVCDEELLYYKVDVPIALDWEVKLSECFNKYNHIKYIFDFDTNFTHSIKLVKVITDYDKVYPVCVGGCQFEPMNGEKISEEIKFVR